MSWFSVSPEDLGRTATAVESDISGIADAGAKADGALSAAAGSVGAANVVAALESFASARRTVVPGLADFVRSCATAARQIAATHVEGDSDMAAQTSATAHGLGMD
ncbi:hypothetical protein GCM10025867_12150 [Frondihabitans sucicola]|uniref:ESX-1 secretion-associated protein n=1 Tax=Frondihabitans sucicola TaxID=1268041 RepID=A0ABN6XVD1_9MICO|nr:DUF6507 family protein [Frondihabitans sucicola]BDZ48974.1 hypothetical protein GCM10025867_12150 [Frondihabitans sucicola]